jgi:hypothetical protein
MEMSTAKNDFQRNGRKYVSFGGFHRQNGNIGHPKLCCVCTWELVLFAGVLEEPINANDNEATQKAKRFYNSCVNVCK